MFYETKIAVRKAFALGKMLFGLGKERYEEFLSITSAIKPPTRDELVSYTDSGYTLEKAIITELQIKYKKAAVSIGLPEEYGLAMLEYAAIEQELKL